MVLMPEAFFHGNIHLVSGTHFQWSFVKNETPKSFELWLQWGGRCLFWAPIRNPVSKNQGISVIFLTSSGRNYLPRWLLLKKFFQKRKCRHSSSVFNVVYMLLFRVLEVGGKKDKFGPNYSVIYWGHCHLPSSFQLS